MRPIVYSLTASLDGYIARADGSFDWINMDMGMPPEEFFRSMYSAFDDVIIGRKSWDTMRAMPGMSTYPGMNNYVVSRTIPPGKRDGVEIISGGLAEWADDLRNRPGKKVWLSGGGELARSFLELGLIDEIQLAIQPILLGRGVPLFPGTFPESKLRLEGSRQFPNGVVLLDYSVVR